MKRRDRSRKHADVSPAKMLEAELTRLRRDLRTTLRAYAAGLEINLAESAAAVGSHKDTNALSRERLHEIRELTILVRKRKLKPEKGRRKDLRKIDRLIRDLHSVTHPNAPDKTPL